MSVNVKIMECVILTMELVFVKLGIMVNVVNSIVLLVFMVYSVNKNVDVFMVKHVMK
ncbi:unnamed protein product [Schistosoma mattheei]|uniref:Uncharacterized protein n=1 Tax=Schistosoma mattheei TaxID=31246 RepID=A0A183NNH0_9TREM|nr:unnamed protein product [Schistosoma mattheei]